jgi:hypothetical protein
MDITSIAQSVSTTVFSLFSSVQVPSVYHSPVNGAYDPVTGTITNVDTTRNINPIFLDYEAVEQKVNFRFGDKRICLKNSELNGIVPKQNDFIVETGNSVRWEVIDIEGDPTGTVWFLHGRRSAT